MEITHNIFKYEKEQYKRHSCFQLSLEYKNNDLMKKSLIVEMNGHWKTQRTLLAGIFEFLKLKNRLPIIQTEYFILLIKHVSHDMISELNCQNNILELIT